LRVLVVTVLEKAKVLTAPAAGEPPRYTLLK
jgi:hypothetical protein